MASPPILEVRRLSLTRGRRRIYENLNLSLHAGITAVLGPNGAGKTTLLDALLRPDLVNKGSVFLNGEAITRGASLKQYHSRLGHMPQDWRYFPGYTAQESVEYVAWLKGLSGLAVSSAARDALGRVQLLEQTSVPVGRMSGGMRQRVGLAEALVNNPSVLLLDEPTVGLDPAQRAAFRAVLMNEGQQRAVLLSTHLTDDVQAVANRVIVVAEGNVVFDGTPLQLAQLSDGASPTSQALEAGYLSVVSASSGANNS